MPKTSKKSEGSCTETTPPLKEKNLWFTGKKASVITVGMIAIIAFVIRAAFSFGTSMDNMFALSGGLEASEHLRTVVQILKGNNVFSGNPIVIDFIIAGIASGVTSIIASPIMAASFVLGTFSTLCGTVIVVIAYIFGLEVIGTKKAGYLTAIFMAFCPIVISQTIFSNGTEVGWHLLLITTFFTSFIKGIKSFNILSKEDKLSNIVKNNHRSMKFGLISGAILALITISTSNFRPVFIILIFIMVTAVIIDRIRNIDPRLPILYFSIVIFIGMIVATTYYIPASLWDNVLSGIFIATMFGVVTCVVFSMLQTRSCAITIPVFIIITLAFFTGLAIITPNLFNSVVYDNNGYAPAVSKLVAGSISISQMSTFFGPVTLWFSAVMIASMLINIRKNIGSHTYITVFMIMIFGTYYGWKSQSYATMFSSIFAIGFAYVVVWLFNSIDFKTYFASFKTANFKTFWKKLIKPVPFASVLSIIFLLIAPNAIYAVDASIFVNQNDDTYGTYDTRIDINNILLTYQQHPDKSGAMVCWFESSSDASTFGGFNTIADSKGNGAVAVSNILLSNGADGSSTAAILIYTLKRTGFDNDIKDKLEKVGLKEEDYYDLKRIVDSPQEFRPYVIDNAGDFDIISPISNESISYLYGKWFLTKKYDGFTISKMYDALADRCKISYFMIDGSLFPMYCWHSSTFNNMAISNGYETKKFIEANYPIGHGTGIYSYTDKMYDTFLWRAYIGMSPKEAGITGIAASSDYLAKLMLSDGKYKAQPGCGFSNYVLDSDHWFVMYNPDKNAKISSDGWTKMLYNEAITKQKESGGLINYLSGLPVFFKYSPNSDGKTVSGTVSCHNPGDSNVKGVRVSAIDSDGVVRSTTHTDNNGKFKINVIDLKSIINFYSGSSNLSDGTLIKTVRVDNNYDAEIFDVEIPQTSVNGEYVDNDGNGFTKLNVKAVIKGKTTGVEGQYIGLSNNISIKNIVPDVYDVTITSPDEKITYVKGTHTVVAGTNNGVEFKPEKAREVTLTFKNESELRLLSGKEASLIDTASNTSYTSKIGDDGRAIYNIPNGEYIIKFNENYVPTQTLSVNADKSETITVIPSKTFELNNFPPSKAIVVYNSWYQTSGIADKKGSLSINLPKGTNNRAIYSAYSVDDEEKVYVAKLDTMKDAVVKPTESDVGVKISGKLKTSSGTTSGTILFIKDGVQILVHPSPDGKYNVSLIKGEYTVYAYANDSNNGKPNVVIESYTVDKPENHDIILKPGKVVEVNVSGQPINRKICYVPFNVNVGSHNLIFVTDENGSYKFCMPEKKCKIEILLDENGPYSVDGNGSIEIDDKEANFKLSADVNVHNNTGYPIKINNVEIENNHENNIEITSNAWPIKIDYVDNSNRFYYEGYMPTPSTKNITIENTFDVVKYYPLTIENADDYKVNVDPIDNGKKIDASNGTYYLEDGKKFRVTAIKNDSKKVLYKNISKTETINVEQTSKPMITLTGFVGFTGSGKITVTIGNEKFDFDVDASGHYKIFVPKCDLKLSVSIENKDDYGNMISLYTASDDIKCSEWEGEKVYNLAVTGEKKNVAGEIKIESFIDKMSINEDVAEITFSLFLNKDNKNKMTYTISGGSDWHHVLFYSNDERTNQTSSVNIDGDNTTVIYGKGTIISSKVGLGSDNLSIILKDLNGKVCGTGVLDDPNGEWSQTNNKSAKVYAEINSTIGPDYMYTVKIVNKDNYAKKFKVGHEQIEGDWHETYRYNEKITNKLDDINVPGYTTAIVYLKLTPEYGQSKLPGSVKFTITPDNDETIEGGPGVTISNNVATFDSETASPHIDVTNSSADGRNVTNNMRSTPIAIWVLIIIIIALLFITIWEASRRGVFTRRK